MMPAKLMRTTTLSVIALAPLVLVFATAANAATSITTCPYGITAPGDYDLDADLTSCSTGGITIEASHVKLKLNTHGLNSGLSSPGPGIYGIFVYSAAGRLTDVHIKGPGAVQNFDVGIEIDNVDNSEVDGVTSTFNSNDGVETGLGLTGTVTNFQLTGSVIAFNRYWGVLLGNSTNGHIQGNVASTNNTGGAGGVAGIGIISGSANEVQANTLVGNNGSGITAGIGGTYSSSGNHICDNVASGSSVYGIFISAGTGNKIENNTALGDTAYGETGYDLADANATCDTDEWHKNTFITSNESCID